MAFYKAVILVLIGSSKAELSETCSDNAYENCQERSMGKQAQLSNAL